MYKHRLLSILTAFLLTLLIIKVNAVEVTFRVDMSEQTVAPEGVHIAGNFQGWNPAGTAMTLSANNIYTYTADFTEGEALEYKFVNGNAWGMDEQVPAGCALNGNRFLTVPANNVTLDAFCFGSCNVCNPPLVDITFQVDMSNETVSPNGVHLAGSFQDPPWQPGNTEMTLIGDGVYAVTLSIGSGDYYEYKFINGNAWGADETVPPDCANEGNRYLTVPDVPVTLEAVCFGSCYPCGPPPIDINVTFQVDMSEQIISPDGVHIGGSFQGWDPGATLMEDAGNNIYTYTTVMSSGTYQEYKFVNGTTWEEGENVPPECGLNNNRYLTLPWNDTVIDVVCFNKCGPCGPPPVDVNVTFRVDMSNEAVSADGVHVAGSFQGWVSDATPMTLTTDNIYEVSMVLQSGFEHQYKFLNGISFDVAEEVPQACGMDDGQGGYNRFFTVPAADTTMPALCFGSCEPCLPPLPDHAVTFKVDMSNEDVSTDGVHLVGSFQGWNAESTPMTLTSDNIFEATLMIEEGTAQEYKFINGINFDFAEEVPEACGVDDGQGGYNRFFAVPAADTTMPALCFGSCEPCLPPLPDHAVTFRVDMTYQDVSPEGVHVAGTFQNWNPASTEMTLTSDNIYEISLMLEEAANHEFKFINGNTLDDAELIPPDCAQNGNRYFTVPTNDTTMVAVCFGSCDPCGPPPTDVEITFVVDMEFETPSPDGVHIAGSFQGWNPTSSEMTFIGDNKYAFTTSLSSGNYHEYKFINGLSWDDAESVPAQCANAGNRYFTVPEQNDTLTAFCFNHCVICDLVGIDDEFQNSTDKFIFYPNPADHTLIFTQAQRVVLFSVDGKIMKSEITHNNMLDISSMPRGFYYILIQNESGSRYRKLIIE